MVKFVIVLMLSGDLAVWWWGDRRLRGIPKAWLWRGLLGVLVGSQFLMLLAWVLFAGALQVLGEAFWRPVSAWLYMWHLLVLPVSLFFFLIVKGAFGAARLTRWRSKKLGPQAGRLKEAPSPAPALSRRRLLGAGAAFAPQLALAAALCESVRQIGKFRVRRFELAIPGLPVGLDGMVIAHVSDTHVGRFVGRKEFDAITDATYRLRPDLIAFTGDLIDYNIGDLPESIAAMKRMREIAPVAMCVGNHDLFDDPTRFRTRVREADLGLMTDEAMRLTIRGHQVELLGLDWGTPESQRSDGLGEHMDRVLSRKSSDAFSILLAHHPHAFDAAAAGGIPLTLSGHTHGGQIMLTDNIGFGRVYRYWSGLYEKGASKLVVSNGVGNWFPLRINAPAEIVQITLRNA
jgi:predicted MPP superfamily phosphohydrolase